MSTRGYIDIASARKGGPLLAQAESFLLVKAVPDVQAEAPETANHANRLAWAAAIEASEAGLARQVQRLVIRLVQNPTIAATIAAGGVAEDSDVEFVGLSVIDDLADRLAAE